MYYMWVHALGMNSLVPRLSNSSTVAQRPLMTLSPLFGPHLAQEVLVLVAEGERRKFRKEPVTEMLGIVMANTGPPYPKSFRRYYQEFHVEGFGFGSGGCRKGLEGSDASGESVKNMLMIARRRNDERLLRHRFEV
jgi:guanyl-specific ribonuclease Sa